MTLAESLEAACGFVLDSRHGDGDSWLYLSVSNVLAISAVLRAAEALISASEASGVLLYALEVAVAALPEGETT